MTEQASVNKVGLSQFVHVLSNLSSKPDDPLCIHLAYFSYTFFDTLLNTELSECVSYSLEICATLSNGNTSYLTLYRNNQDNGFPWKWCGSQLGAPPQ